MSGHYGRDYWDIYLPGRDGYAEHMTARGFVVIAVDPLGVGDSGRPEDGTCARTTRLPTPPTEQ